MNKGRSYEESETPEVLLKKNDNIKTNFTTIHKRNFHSVSKTESSLKYKISLTYHINITMNNLKLYRKRYIVNIKRSYNSYSRPCEISKFNN